MNDWNYDIDSCPLDTKVRLLSADNCFFASADGVCRNTY
nr:MAG TPA: hypothetical protein [Caudoviricetes sp.]